jgi:ubiquinone/menaquinone biosynthesis C-methylase UbiE
VKGPKVFDVGVGTGMNIPYYSVGLDITAIVLTPGMLDRAKARSQVLGGPVHLCLGDVQRLAFPDHSFDAAVATFVFCSVSNPVLGLQEIRRVLKPGGTLLMDELMRYERPVIRKLMDFLLPLVVRIIGANINRRTLENVRRSGFEIVQVNDLAGEVFSSGSSPAGLIE